MGAKAESIIPLDRVSDAIQDVAGGAAIGDYNLLDWIVVDIADGEVLTPEVAAVFQGAAGDVIYVQRGGRAEHELETAVRIDIDDGQSANAARGRIQESDEGVSYPVVDEHSAGEAHTNILAGISIDVRDTNAPNIRNVRVACPGMSVRAGIKSDHLPKPVRVEAIVTGPGHDFVRAVAIEIDDMQA